VRTPFPKRAHSVLATGSPIAVTGSADGTVRVWDLNTGAPVGDPLIGPTGVLRAVGAPD